VCNKYNMLKFDIPDDDWPALAALGLPTASFQVLASDIGLRWDTIMITDPAVAAWLLLQLDQLPWIVERT
jgi:hypothetical protein